MNQKKVLSLLLASGMTLSMMTGTASAAFRDTEGHWAEAPITRWNSYQVLNGFEDGLFLPENWMTRAEFATMLANLMGYTVKAENVFDDVPETAWYADAVLKLSAAGVMKGANGKANPNDPISREEAVVMLCRAMGIKNTAPVSEAPTFKDDHEVSDWAKDSVAALSQRDMIHGMGDNMFAPKLEINRASVAKMMDNMVSNYVTEDGTTVTGEQKGIVIVAADNVTIKDTSLKENLIVAPKASGEVKLEGVTSDASVIVNAESSKLITDTKTTVDSVVVAAPKAEVSISGKTNTVKACETATGSKVDVAKGAQVSKVEVAAKDTTTSVAGKVDKVDVADTAAGTTVDVARDAQVKDMNVAAKDTTTNVSGKVDNVNVEDTAEGSKVEVGKDAEIGKLDTSADNVQVGGNGTIKDVVVSGGSNITVDKDTTVDNVENKGGNSVDVGGTNVDQGETIKPPMPNRPEGGGGGGGGGDGRPSPPVQNYVASNGRDSFTSLKMAISQSNSGDKITLLKDISLTPENGQSDKLTPALTISKNLTLDLNGKSIGWNTAAGSFTGVPTLFSIEGNGVSVTVYGGTVNAELGSNGSYGFNVNHGAQLNISGGTYYGAPSAVQVQNGTLNINGGEFYLAPTNKANAPDLKNYIVNCLDTNWPGNAHIYITDGAFGFNPSANPEGENTTYVKSGYKATQSGDTWTVGPQ